MTDSNDHGFRSIQPRLEIAALLAQLSGFITGPIGIIAGWVITARSRRWESHEKTMAYVLAIPMTVLFLQPFGGGTGLAIDITAAVVAITMVIPLYRSAARKHQAGQVAAGHQPSSRHHVNPALLLAGWVITALASFASWWLWMGWDGDDLYVPWQVVGSALTVLVIVLAAWWFLPNRVTVSAVTIGYAIGWGASSMPGDESGMSGVGLIMVAFGLLAVSAVIVVLADAVAASLRRTNPV